MALTWTEMVAPGSEHRSYEARAGAKLWTRVIVGSNGKFYAEGSALLADATRQTFLEEHDTFTEGEEAVELWWEALVPP